MNEQSIGARIGFAGTLECKDAAGNVLQTIDFKGSVPLADLGISDAQAAQLTKEEYGSDHR